MNIRQLLVKITSNYLNAYEISNLSFKIYLNESIESFLGNFSGVFANLSSYCKGIEKIFYFPVHYTII